jgi:hypothetical protein
MKTKLLILLAIQFIVQSSWGTNSYIGNIRKEVAVTTSMTTNVTPTFTQLGPYFAGGNANALPVFSLNGIPGNWSPDVINTAIVGTCVYTFTPTIPSASPTTMMIKIKPAVTQIGITQDIGTTVLAYWPVVSGAKIYAFQYRPFGSSAAWLGIGTILNCVKVSNLTPGLHYECRIIPYKRSGFPMPGVQTGDFWPQEFQYTKDFDMGTALRINWPDFLSWASSNSFYYKKSGDNTWMMGGATVNHYCKTTTIPDSTYNCQVAFYIGGSFWGKTQIGEFKADAFSSSVDNSTGNALDLSWTELNAGDPAPWVVDQFVKYRVKNSTSPWIQKHVIHNTSTAQLSGLTPNTDYEFQVYVYLNPNYWGTTPLGYFKSTVDGTVNPGITHDGNNVYPNPFIDKLNVDMFTENETNVIWNLYDMTGKEVLSGNESISKGYSTLNINTENLSNGVFVLNTIINDQTQSFRIIK